MTEDREKVGGQGRLETQAWLGTMLLRVKVEALSMHQLQGCQRLGGGGIPVYINSSRHATRWALKAEVLVSRVLST